MSACAPLIAMTALNIGRLDGVPQSLWAVAANSGAFSLRFPETPISKCGFEINQKRPQVNQIIKIINQKIRRLEKRDDSMT